MKIKRFEPTIREIAEVADEIYTKELQRGGAPTYAQAWQAAKDLIRERQKTSYNGNSTV